jgi:hypothetical protein
MRLIPYMAALLLGCGSGDVLARIDGAPVPDAPEPPDAIGPPDLTASVDAGLQGIFTTAPALIRSLWADNEAVYWATDDTVARCRLSDGYTVQLATGEANPLSLHGDPSPPAQTWLFWTAGGSNPGIRRSPDSSPNPIEFVSAPPTPYHLALDDFDLFWTDYAGAVYATSQDIGGQARTLAVTSPATAIALTTDWVYFEESAPRSIQRVGKEAGSPVVIIQSSPYLKDILAASADANIVYWVDDKTLVRFSEYEGGFAQDVVTEPSWIRAVTVRGNSVYWIVRDTIEPTPEHDKGFLKRMSIFSLDPQDAEVIAQDFILSEYSEIRIGGDDDEWVFWFSGTDVWRAPQ